MRAWPNAKLRRNVEAKRERIAIMRSSSRTKIFTPAELERFAAERGATVSPLASANWMPALLHQTAAHGRWDVVRLNDRDGRREVLRRGIAEVDADRIASSLRDGCPDSDVDAGWNYLPERSVRCTSQ
jgi:hypothetical protein